MIILILMMMKIKIGKLDITINQICLQSNLFYQFRINQYHRKLFNTENLNLKKLGL